MPKPPAPPAPPQNQPGRQQSSGNNGGGSNVGSNTHSAPNDNPVEEVKSAITKHIASSFDAAGQALINGVISSRDDKINSAGLCGQGSGVLVAVGISASGCLHSTLEDGAVLTGSAAVLYPAAGLEVGLGPAVPISNAANANELGGIDLLGGGTFKYGIGAEVTHSRSIDPGDIGIWGWNFALHGGAGGAAFGGVSTTGAIDIPWF